MIWSGLGSTFSAVYKLPSKSAESTLEILRNLFLDRGIPAGIITDREESKNFSTGWIKTCAKYKVEQLCSKAYTQNQNYIEQFIQDGKSGISKFRSATGLHDCKHMYKMWQHFSDTQNHMNQRSLKNRTPFEVFMGETPDLSVLQFASYEPLWYREFNAKADEIKLFPGRFLGISWNVGNALCFKVLVQRKGKRDEILSRPICVPRDPMCDIPPNLTGKQVQCKEKNEIIV